MAKYPKDKKKDLYYTRVATGRYNPKGQILYKKIYGHTIAEIDMKLKQYHAQQVSGIFIDDSRLTIDMWAKKWLDV